MLDVTRAYGLEFLFPAKDKIIGAALREFGEFGRPEVDAIDALMGRRKTGTFVDIGANIGAVALPIAARHGRSRVIAVEANRRVSNLLAANVFGNRLENVEVINAAVGELAGLIAFPATDLSSDMNFGGIGLVDQRGAQSFENVRVCTLDEIAPADTHVVKIDVEGYEYEVLQGGRRLLQEIRPSWVFEWKDSAKSRSVVQAFLDARYRLYWLWTPFVTPTAAKRPFTTSTIAGDTNVLALPDDSSPPLDMPLLLDANESRPSASADYPYLRGYGIAPAP